MKRFLLFAFARYEPNGGWQDFQQSFDTVEEAVEFLDATSKQVKDKITDDKVGTYSDDDVMTWRGTSFVQLVDSTTGLFYTEYYTVMETADPDYRRAFPKIVQPGFESVRA